MNILSLFDWISCGRLALERAGIKVDKYFASEIDKYAIQIAKKNYPDTIHIGSVTDVSYRPWCLKWKNEWCVPTDMYIGTIWMIIWWSPCQDLSIAKKDGKWLQWEKSWLFFEYVRLLKEVKPKYFLLENVASMKKADKEEITRILTGIYPDTQCYLINSALVSAQQRRRLYWTNIQWVEQPEDKGILLKDILQTEGEVDMKSYCIPATYHKENTKSLEKRNKTGLMVRVWQFNSWWQWDRAYSPEWKSVSLSATTVQTDSMVAITPRIGQPQPYPRNYNELWLPRTEVLEFRDDNKTNSVITNPMKNVLDDGAVIRKLTPIECERLQTLPDNWTEGVSNTQRYKAIWNGWTVDVIAHIFSYIKP